MNYSIVASRYAKSLLGLAIERKELESCFKDMKIVFETCHSSKDLSIMLKSPVIRADKKIAVLTAVFGKSVSELSMGFINIITKKKREMHLEGIAYAFMDQYKKYNNITTAKVSTAIALDKALKDKILAIVKTKATGDVELVEEVNEELIGGFVLKIDDTQLDASVQHQLKELKKNFNKNPYVKEF